jgi:hypothetical protein
MRTYIRIQLMKEHTKEFANQGLRSAVNTALNEMSKEDAATVGCLTCDGVFGVLICTWSRVGSDTNPGGGGAGSYGERERAMIASAARIMVKEESKKTQANGAKRQEVSPVDTVLLFPP